MAEYTREQVLANRKHWAAMLRSGAYKQATSALRRANGMCCLGVACDLSPDLGKWHWNGGEWQWECTDEYGMFFSHGGVASSEIQKRYGLQGDTGRVIGRSNPNDVVATSLAGLNDHGGFGFNDIADIIEGKHPEYLLAGEKPEDWPVEPPAEEPEEDIY